MFFFHMRSERKSRIKIELEKQESDKKLFENFIEKYGKVHYTDIKDGNSIWKFLSNKNEDEFINVLNEYKKLKFKSKRWNN